MFTHPAITAALADQHRQDLITQASAYRLARAARNSRPTLPGRSPQPRRRTGPLKVIRRAVIATAAVFAAAAVLIASPAGTGRWWGPQASAAHSVTQQVSAFHFR